MLIKENIRLGGDRQIIWNNRSCWNGEEMENGQREQHIPHPGKIVDMRKCGPMLLDMQLFQEKAEIHNFHVNYANV